MPFPLIPLHPPLSKGGNVSPPFGKGRWGGILTSLFQTAKLILKMVWRPLKRNNLFRGHILASSGGSYS